MISSVHAYIYQLVYIICSILSSIPELFHHMLLFTYSLCLWLFLATSCTATWTCTPLLFFLMLCLHLNFLPSFIFSNSPSLLTWMVNIIIHCKNWMVVILFAVLCDTQCLCTCVWNVCACVAHRPAQTLSITKDKHMCTNIEYHRGMQPGLPLLGQNNHSVFAVYISFSILLWPRTGL